MSKIIDVESDETASTIIGKTVLKFDWIDDCIHFTDGSFLNIYSRETDYEVILSD